MTFNGQQLHNSNWWEGERRGSNTVKDPQGARWHIWKNIHPVNAELLLNVEWFFVHKMWMHRIVLCCFFWRISDLQVHQVIGIKNIATGADANTEYITNQMCRNMLNISLVITIDGSEIWLTSWCVGSYYHFLIRFQKHPKVGSLGFLNHQPYQDFLTCSKFFMCFLFEKLCWG